jgi:hypothetical protein
MQPRTRMHVYTHVYTPTTRVVVVEKTTLEKDVPRTKTRRYSPHGFFGFFFEVGAKPVRAGWYSLQAQPYDPLPNATGRFANMLDTLVTRGAFQPLRSQVKAGALQNMSPMSVTLDTSQLLTPPLKAVAV